MSDAVQEPLRVAVAGVGAVSQVVHLPILATRSDVQVVAVSDRDNAKAEAIAQRFEVPEVRSDEDVLADPTIAGLIVCTPNHSHEELATRALAAGKHVFVERPLALDAAGVERVLAAARAADRSVLVGLPHRYRPDSAALHSFVAGGELGPVYAVRGKVLNRKLTLPRATWRQRSSEAGGGAWMDLGVALADLVLWLVGYPRVARVSAVMSTGDYEVEDAASVLAETENGISLTLEVSWSLFADSDRYSAQVLGREGSGWLPPLAVYKQLGGRPIEVTPDQPRLAENAYMASYRRLLDRFIRCLGVDRAPELPTEQVEVMRLIEAAYESAREGKEVSLL